MRADKAARTGGEILVDQLVAQGVRHVFCVPGESYLAALDAFHDRSIALTVCRQEGGAAMMAEAAGKATGRPGICFVTRGPGATNASLGVHIAQQDSTPLILFVGQVARGARGREAPCSARWPNGRARSRIRRAFPSWSRGPSTPR
jgi:acetolactate synthase-1/2/3 large subunit